MTAAVEYVFWLRVATSMTIACNSDDGSTLAVIPKKPRLLHQLAISSLDWSIKMEKNNHFQLTRRWRWRSRDGSKCRQGKSFVRWDPLRQLWHTSQRRRTRRWRGRKPPESGTGWYHNARRRTVETSPEWHSSTIWHTCWFFRTMWSMPSRK